MGLLVNVMQEQAGRVVGCSLCHDDHMIYLGYGGNEGDDHHKCNGWSKHRQGYMVQDLKTVGPFKQRCFFGILRNALQSGQKNSI